MRTETRCDALAAALTPLPAAAQSPQSVVTRADLNAAVATILEALPGTSSGKIQMIGAGGASIPPQTEDAEYWGKLEGMGIPEKHGSENYCVVPCQWVVMGDFPRKQVPDQVLSLDREGEQLLRTTAVFSRQSS